MGDFGLGSVWSCERVRLVVTDGEPKYVMSKTLTLTVEAVESLQVVFAESGGRKQKVPRKLLKRFTKLPDGSYKLIEKAASEADVASYIRFSPVTGNPE